ncbi:MAG: 3-dehydroquinate synthase [Oscillospiraceae bacterium]|jgi:3-dehydroquinate synthase|nr:3-dehydroquinate synthase [Oscillospiraceae bacterium]
MELTVHTSEPYRIIIERGCLGRAGGYAAKRFRPGSRTVIVADSNVAPLYAKQISRSLKEAGFSAGTFVFPAGEESKRLSSIEKIYGAFARNRLTRSDFAVALGGGVTGDMAGFAAATWLRGIPFVQIPTSLLAQIDSSIGGKTGVDVPEGKNLVGAFHQPSLVLIDPDTLQTLPPRFFSDGMGEAIKHGCIKSRPLFDFIKTSDVRTDMERLIAENLKIKRAAVEQDEFDNGERMLLNFGHTFGHALEKLHGYRGLSHGQAVGIGMVMMAQCGEKAGLTEPGTAAEIASVLQRYGLPVSDKEITDPRPIIETAMLDKKALGGTVRLVMLKKIGESFLYPADKKRLTELLEAVL